MLKALNHVSQNKYLRSSPINKRKTVFTQCYTQVVPTCQWQATPPYLWVTLTIRQGQVTVDDKPASLFLQNTSSLLLPCIRSPCLAKLTREYKKRDLDSIPEPLKNPRISWRLKITSSRSCRCQRFRNSTVAVPFWCDLQLMAEEDPSSLLRTANLDVGFYILRNCKHEFRNNEVQFWISDSLKIWSAQLSVSLHAHQCFKGDA